MAENIDFFYRFTVLLLNHLYENFPCPVTVNAYDLAITLEPEDVDEATAMRDFEIGFHAVTWLSEEDYLRFDEVESLDRRAGFLDTRLSERGIHLLNSVTDLESGDTIASKFRSLVKSGLATARDESVKQAVQLLFQSAA